MGVVRIIIFFGMISVLGLNASRAQNIYGYIRDADTGEELIAATIYIPALVKGTSTNSYGFYSLNVEEGSFLVRLQYLGYEVLEQSIEVNGSVNIDFRLKQSGQLLSEIEVSGSPVDKNNLEAIKKIIDFCGLIGRRIAHIDEARKILGIVKS